jgi:N-acetylglucosaminylphosphatidylinositol deacetylase
MLTAVLYGRHRDNWAPSDVTAWSSYDSKGLFVNSLSTWRENVNAFWAHSSQRSWDRWLYMVVSRYMWFNDIVKVDSIIPQRE